MQPFGAREKTFLKIILCFCCRDYVCRKHSLLNDDVASGSKQLLYFTLYLSDSLNKMCKYNNRNRVYKSHKTSLCIS